MIHNATGDHAAAEECFAIAVEAFGVGDWTWVFRGANLADANQFDAALQCYRRALTLGHADHDEACLSMGYALRAQGKYAGAINAFQSALALTPG